jgi:fructosamine-3-kinase
MPDWSSIVETLRNSGVGVASNVMPRPIGGGDISAAWRLEADEFPVFVKTGRGTSWEMFAAEAEGLAELARAGAIRVPRVLACGVEGDTSFVALEWLDFDRASPDTEARLGEGLAKLHRTVGRRYGWHRDNTIGLTPQRNEWSHDWVEFFRARRLGFQLQLAADRGYTGSLQEQGALLMKRLPVFFDAYEPDASLLHGDLWGGNWASCDSEPVIFDPAVYYGDRESDLAMTRLFGGFGAAFYEAYESNAPLAPGHEARCDLYQLYHVLNHLNLFGSAYLGRAQSLMANLLGAPS